MKKKWLLVVGLISVLAIVGLAGCNSDTTALGEIQEFNLNSSQQGIWVSGQGKVMAVPDIATLRLGIEAQESTVVEAQAQATEAMERVMAALIVSGVAKKDIQTQHFSIQRVTKWNREKEQQEMIGYRVTNLVTAKIRDIDEAGSIIDAVAKVGGDLTRIDNISFSVDNMSAYYDEAREKAMVEVKAKAKQLAKLAGVTLGKPTYISEGVQTPPIALRDTRFLKEMAVAEVETVISPGELEINLTLQTVYSIR